ncbi:hypothetical protein [Steroidobacter cummioxidans]|uniref:hypothetical protein n=1 Tax=Steroidobacter cummioxidans TaxID=1803913 RepID=UPI000E317756|nr:hypothetical protein [Steroidobacter cummioxidans]
MVTQIAASSDSGDSNVAGTTHTVPSGSDLVSYLFFFRNGARPISSVNSFGGVTPVRIDDDTYPEIAVYRALNPTPGATAATANLSSSTMWSAHVITLSGVDQSAPEGTLVYDTNAEEAWVRATVASAVDDLCIAFGLVVSQDIAASYGSTLSTEEEAIEGGYVSTAVAFEAGAASVELGFSTSASFGDNRIIAVPVRKVPPLVPVISNVNDTNALSSTQVGNVINGTLLAGATVQITQGTTTVSQSVTATAPSSASFTTVFDAPHLRYGAATLRAINAAGPSEPVSVNITPPTGRSFVNLTSLHSQANGRITAIPDLAVGDQLEISNVVGGTIADVTVNSNGTFNVDDAVTAFTVRAWSANDSMWGPYAVQQVSNA